MQLETVRQAAVTVRLSHRGGDLDTNGVHNNDHEFLFFCPNNDVRIENKIEVCVPRHVCQLCFIHRRRHSFITANSGCFIEAY